MKKALFITAIILACTGLSGYYGYFYVTPNVTVVNSSQNSVPSFVVTLPNSRLNFGSLDPGATNTIYYSMDQSDGNYSANVVTSDGSKLHKSCGSVTKNELHKRVVITYTKSGRIVCKGT